MTFSPDWLQYGMAGLLALVLTGGYLLIKYMLDLLDGMIKRADERNDRREKQLIEMTVAYTQASVKTASVVEQAAQQITRLAENMEEHHQITARVNERLLARLGEN